MEMINNRYRLVELLDQNEFVATYLAVDLLQGQRFIQLNLLNSEYTPTSLVDFYAKKFISITNLNHKQIARNYEFGTVHFVDNKFQTDQMFYYTVEFNENTQPLLDYVKKWNIVERIERFIELCSAIHYLHLSGFVYGSLGPNGIQVVDSGNQVFLKLKDLATVELENFQPHEVGNTYYQSPGILAGQQPSVESDMFSLGVILLVMLRQEPRLTNLREDLQTLKEEWKTFRRDEQVIVKKVLPIIEKLTTIEDTYPYQHIQAMIIELEKALERSISVIDKQTIEKLNFNTEIVGRDGEIDLILKNVDRMLAYKPSKRIFFVQGDIGIGKTRFLQEMSFLLSLRKVTVYANFMLESSGSKQLWIDILQKLISQSDTTVVRKYHAELVKYFPELENREHVAPIDYLLEGNNRYRLISRMVSFISEILQDKTAILLIDDLHLADSFTLDLLSYLSTKVMNLMIILSGEVRKDCDNTAYMNSIELLEKRTDTSIIQLHTLTKEQSAQMIQHILALSYPPVKLAEQIFSRTYGNPLFIHEVMKDLYSREILQVSPEDGGWSVRLQALDYDTLEVPDSIEQALINQLHDLSKKQLEVLKAVAIYRKPVPVLAICDFLMQEENMVEEDVSTLLQKGILQQLISDDGYVFEFKNKILKQMVYDAIDRIDKIDMHSRVAGQLENEQESKMEELIFHYEAAGNKEKCLHYYLEIANQLHERHEIKAEISYLEKAAAIVEDQLEKTKLYMKIGDLCLEVNLTTQGLRALESALELAEKTNHPKNILAVFLALANLHATLYQIDQVKTYLLKIDEAFPELKDKEFRLEYKRLHALLLGLENHPDEAEEIIYSIIEESEDKLPRITGNAYLLLGYTSIQHNKLDEAIDHYFVAMNLMESAGYMKGYLGAVNNIGVIYQNYMNKLDRAMKYFVKVRDLSEEYGIFETEIRALSSIGNIYANAYKFPEAYEHFKHALQKAELGGSKWVMYHLYNLLCLTCAEMGHYKKALKYYNLVLDLYEKNELNEIQTFDFYHTSMNFYQLIGDFNLANEYSKKVIDFHQGRDNIYSYSAMMFKNINALRTVQDGQLDKLISEIISLVDNIPRGEFNLQALIKAALVLEKRKMHSTTKPIIQKLEEYLSEQTPDSLRARYYYLLGMKDSSAKSITYLHLGLELAKKAKHPEIIAKIMLLLGDYAFLQDQLYRAANYYLEGTEVVKSVVEELPKECRPLFVNHHYFARGFVRLERIYEWLSGGQVAFEHRDVLERTVLSEEKLGQLLENNYVAEFVQHQDFMEYIREDHMNMLSENIRSASDILKYVSGNTLKNLDMVLRYFAGLTLASRGVLITENVHEELTVLCSTDGNHVIPPSRSMIHRAMDTKETFLVTEKEQHGAFNLLSKDLQGALYIPVIQKQGPTSKNDSVLGVVYLETDRFVNNFTESGLANCTEIMGFLAAMLEKVHLKRSATIDKLTGALTRKYLDDALQDMVEFSRTNGEQFSMIMFDLDRFKQVNDWYGHQIGDNILRKVSNTVMDHLKEHHILGRYGGEEFIIVLPSLGSEEAKEFAEVIREKVFSQKLLGDKLDITVSMGIATYPNHGQHVKELISKADQALYVAKENGRNNAMVWQKEFVNKSKPQNKLSGILTGDDIQDSRNVLAMVELIQLNNKPLKLEDKIYQFLGRIIEITEAQIGSILLNHLNGQKYYSRKAQEEGWSLETAMDQQILNSVLLEERGLYTINWDVKDKMNTINGLPDWESILAVPIMIDGSVRGVIYLSTPTRLKEFGANDLNMLTVYSNLLAGMI